MWAKEHAMKVEASLPQALAEEVLWQYADVLRVGRLTLNGVELAWNNSTSNDAQLSGFCSTFIGALRQRPELAGIKDTDLCQATHWFCKSVSINYALSELLSLLQRRLGERLGAVCSVMTSGPGGAVLVDYAVEVTERQTMRVRVSWRGKGNIVCCNPHTAKKYVKGTLSFVETEFPIPPEPGFTPTYRVQMKLKGSRSSQLLNKVARTFSGKRAIPVEELKPGAPLRSEPCLGSRYSAATPGAASVVSTSTGSSGNVGGEATAFSDDSDCEEGVEEDLLLPTPLSFEAKTVRSQSGSLPRPCAAGTVRALPRGLIRL